MNCPAPGDYIDLHNHGGRPQYGRFCVESLMAHEEAVPDSQAGMTYTYGIHPWFLTGETRQEQMKKVNLYAAHSNVIALGEAGFDKLRGPDPITQRETFEDQALLARELGKPLVIHCVRAWEELLQSHSRIKPRRPWMIHGFRGKKELALQLISKGMYISFWFDFILRPESSALVRILPAERIFLETDGSGTDIKTIYEKVARDREVDEDRLKEQIFSNYFSFFE